MGKGNFFKKGKTADGVVKTEATGDAAKNEVKNNVVEDNKPEGSQSKVAETSGKANFTGLIFMCNSSTKQDCFKYRVFGLPDGKKDLVEQVKKGMRLFLFDVELKVLYGVYKASSRGGYKLEPEAFRGSSKAFPWQVRFDIFQECIPLEEPAFKSAIRENCNFKGKFNIELSLEQVQKLVKLFRPLPKETAASGDLPRRMVPSRQVEAPPKSDYKLKFPARSNYEPSLAAEDVNRAHEARLQQETRHLDLINKKSGVIPPVSLPAYGTDPLLPELQLQNDVHRAREARLQQETRHLDLINKNSGVMGYIPPVSLPAYGTDPILPQLQLQNDVNRAREARLQQETRHLDLINKNSGVTDYIPPVSLAAYGTDPILAELQLQKADPYQSRAGYDLYSSYPQVHTLGNLAGEVDALYRQRLVPDARGDLLNSRVYGLGPLVESSSSYNGLDNRGLLFPPSRSYLQEQSLPGNEFDVRLPYGGTSVIPGAFSGLASQVAPQGRQYFGSGLYQNF